MISNHILDEELPDIHELREKKIVQVAREKYRNGNLGIRGLLALPQISHRELLVIWFKMM